jgi:hypothetical protein
MSPLCWLLSVGLGWATVSAEPPPRVGVESTLTVLDDAGAPVPGATVRALHREGLAGARELAIGITDAEGQVRWTPKLGGPTLVEAGNQRQHELVAWDQPPAETLISWLLLLVAAAVAWWAGKERR